MDLPARLKRDFGDVSAAVGEGGGPRGALGVVDPVATQSRTAQATDAPNSGILHASVDGKTWRQVQFGTYANTSGAQRIELPQACTAATSWVTSLHGGRTR